MMTVSEQLKQCRTPQEALLMLADEIDALREYIASATPQPADPWQQPLEWVAPADLIDDLPSSASLKDDRAESIDAVKEQLKTAVGDDATALQAKLRLLKDTDANVMQPAVDEGDRAAIDSDGTTGTVDIPPPTQERMDARGAWAIEHKLWEFIPLDEYDAVDAFSKGGTAWLYYANREAIMQMPFDWRIWLVEDLAVDSPAEAQEVGRDLLKSQQSADRDITVQAVQAMGDARG